MKQKNMLNFWVIIMAHLSGMKILIIYLIKIMKKRKKKFENTKKKSKAFIEKFKSLLE